MIDIFITKHPKNKSLIDYLHERIQEENTIFECSSEDLAFYLGAKHCDLVISMEHPNLSDADKRFNNIRTVMSVNRDVPVVHILKGDDTTSSVVVKALKLGASDCLRNPFSYVELYYRIMAILSKTRHRTEQREIKQGYFVLVPNYRTLRYEGPKKNRPRLEEIPTRECQLLELFFSNPEKILSRTDILKACWGRVDTYTSRILSNYVGKLKRRLEDDPSLMIETIRTEGVVLRVNR